VFTGTADPFELAFKKAASLLIPEMSIYYNDWQAWTHDCIDFPEGQGPTPYQDDIMAALPHYKRVSVRGPHGLGKTALMSWAVLWFACEREKNQDDWKVPTLASVWRQLDKFLWPEIHKWARRIKWDRVGIDSFRPTKELLELNLKLRYGSAFALASDTPESLEGAHADHILYVFDESKAIPSPVFDAAEGAFSGAGSDTVLEALALMFSTPGEPAGRFADIHLQRPGTEDWFVRHVTLEEAIAAGRISRDWAEARARQWGVTSSIYQNRVLGEFADQAEDSVIPLKWVELANKRWEEWKESGVVKEIDPETNEVKIIERKDPPLVPLSKLGVDVARTGEDSTVMAPRHGRVVPEVHRYALASTMQTARYARYHLDVNPSGIASVDVIGIGAGVVDRLKELGYNVDPFNGGSKTYLRDVTGEVEFVNRRAAAWWTMRELLDPQYNLGICLPPDDILTGDLVAPKWKVTAGGKIQIESKEEIKKRIGRSPDSGDAVVMAFCPIETPEYEYEDLVVYDRPVTISRI
jgi:hypothetical protein